MHASGPGAKVGGPAPTGATQESMHERRHGVNTLKQHGRTGPRIDHLGALGPRAGQDVAGTVADRHGAGVALHHQRLMQRRDQIVVLLDEQPVLAVVQA